MQTKNYYEGTPPTGENFIKPVKLGKFNKRIWWISHTINNESEWANIKVFSLQRKKSKANFYLAHNSERFADNKCFNILFEHYPELLKAIEKYWFE
jgi:hypothetical protein